MMKLRWQNRMNYIKFIQIFKQKNHKSTRNIAKNISAIERYLSVINYRTLSKKSTGKDTNNDKLNYD